MTTQLNINKMPRQGDGSSDNAIEPGHNIIHGAGAEKVCLYTAPSILAYLPHNPCPEGLRCTIPHTTWFQTTRVGRADKTAPMPEHEHGAGLEKPGPSGGRSAGKDQSGRKATN